MDLRKWLPLLAVVALVLVMTIKKATSTSAADLIKKHEGLMLATYTDAAGYKTIGWGHKLVAGENYSVITQAQAEALLQADIDRIWNAIQDGIQVDLTDNQKAAVICFAFNVGASAFLKSTLLQKLNAGDVQGAADQFLVWNKARINGVLTALPGLTARRQDERDVFLS